MIEIVVAELAPEGQEPTDAALYVGGSFICSRTTASVAVASPLAVLDTSFERPTDVVEALASALSAATGVATRRLRVELARGEDVEWVYVTENLEALLGRQGPERRKRRRDRRHRGTRES